MEGLTEEQEMQRAIQMSMAATDTSAGGAAGGSTGDEAMQDPDFMNSVLGSLAGVDTSDPRIQNVLQGFSSASSNAKKDGDQKKEDKDRKDGDSK